MTIRWGIIGCGAVTEVKSGPGFQQAAGSALVAVMRRDAARAEDYAKRHGVPRWYADADALIADREVDAVYVATPPGSHEELALKVCAAGKPCYVEKPMARNAAECERMTAAFAAKRLPLFVAYYRRGLARFVTARELVASGRLGGIAAVSYQYRAPLDGRLDPTRLPWRFDAEQAGGGLFLDLGSHTLDIIDFILGPLSEVDGFAANHGSPYAVEDRVALRFRCGPAMGMASWDFAATGRSDRIEIVGSAGHLVLSTFGDEPLTVVTSSGAEQLARPNAQHVQQPLIQRIVDQLHGRDECPSTGATALRTQRVMDQALSSYYGGRGDGFWRDHTAWPGRRHG